MSAAPTGRAAAEAAPVAPATPVSPAARAATIATAALTALAALAALMLASSCDPELNEIEIDPRLPVATAYQGGSWERVYVLNCGRGQRCFAAWSPEEGLTGGNEGMILHWRDGRVWNEDLPVRLSVFGLAAREPGIAYALVHKNAVYRYEGGAWTRDRTADNGWQLRRIWCDRDGTVTAVGEHGRIQRRVGGVWSAVALDLEENLEEIWGDGDGELWIAGEAGVLVHCEDGAWTVERPFGDGAELMDVAGDAQGNLAVLAAHREGEYEDRHDIVYWRAGGTWQELPPLDRWSGKSVVLVEGRPLVFFTYGHYAWWDGSTWVAGETEGDGAGIFRDTVAVDGLVLGLDYDGMLIRWAGGLGERAVDSQGALRSVVLAGADTLVQTSSGSVLRRQSGQWEPELKIASPASDRAMLLDDAGVPCVAGARDLHRREGGSWRPLPLPIYVTAVFALADRSLCLISHEDEVWVFTGGTLRKLGVLPGNPEMIGAAGPSAREFWLCSRYHLFRFDGTGFTTARMSDDGESRILAWSDADGLLIGCRDGLFAWEGDGTRQITPRRDWALTETRYGFAALAPLPAGDLLAWVEPGLLLRRVSGVWDYPQGAGFDVVREQMTVSGGSWGSVYGGGQDMVIVATAPGAAICASPEALYIYRDAPGRAACGD